MTGEIFIAMAGGGIELWAECVQRNVVALG